VAALGYRPYVDTLQLAQTPVDVGALYLQENAVQLEGVNIATKTPPAVMQGDTMVFNADAFKTDPNKDAEELVEKMPGIDREDGALQAQGEEVTRIYVDGKPFFGNDPKAALRNLPAGAVKKIEVYNEQGERSQATGFNTGQTYKTINIVLKEEARKGQFGELYAGYGTQDRYDAGGNLARINGDRRIALIGQANNINQQNFSTEALTSITNSSAGPSYRRFSRGSDAYKFVVPSSGGVAATYAGGLYYTDTWAENVDVTAGYLYNQRENTQRETRVRDFLQREAVDSTRSYTENSTANSLGRDHRFSGELEWEPDTMNRFLWQPNFSYSTDDGLTESTGRTRQGPRELSNVQRAFESDLASFTAGNRFLYSHQFDTTGRQLALESTTNLTGDDGQSSLFSSNRSLENPENSDTTNQQAQLDQFGWSQTSSASYTEPIGQGQLLVTYENFYSNNENDRRTERLNPETGRYTRLDTGLSNTYSSQYLAHRPTLGFQWSGEQYQLNASLEYEIADLWNDQQFPVNTEVNRRFLNFKPGANLRYEFNRQHSFNLRYRTNTSPPSVEQLQSAIDNSNPLQLQAGNPDLQQEYMHTVSLRHRLMGLGKGSIFSYFRTSWSPNYIGNRALVPRQDTVLEGSGIRILNGGQLTRPANMDGYWHTFGFMSYNRPLDVLQINLDVDALFRYNQTPGIINGQRNLTSDTQLEWDVELTSNISEEIDFRLHTEGEQHLVRNTLDRLNSNDYYKQESDAELTWEFWQGVFVQSNLQHRTYRGLNEAVAPTRLRWNLAAGMRFFPKDQLEVKFRVFDVLNRNRDVTRSVTETYIQDSERNVLDRYFLLKATYQFRQFNGVEPKGRSRGPRG
jgi:hypothetical protein